MTLRQMAKKTGISPATLYRVGRGKPLSQVNLIRVLTFMDKDLGKEVEACLAYIRTSIRRRAKNL